LTIIIDSLFKKFVCFNIYKKRKKKNLLKTKTPALLRAGEGVFFGGENRYELKDEEQSYMRCDVDS
jgi:hypothetical protein